MKFTTSSVSFSLRRYEAILEEFANATVASLSSTKVGTTIRLGGIVTKVSRCCTSTEGESFRSFELVDQAGAIRTLVKPDVFSGVGRTFKNGTAVLLSGRLEVFNGSFTIIADNVEGLEAMRQRGRSTLVLRFRMDSIDTRRLEHLHKLFDSRLSSSRIVFEIVLPDGNVARIQPNKLIRITVTPEIASELQRSFGNCQLELLLQPFDDEATNIIALDWGRSGFFSTFQPDKNVFESYGELEPPRLAEYLLYLFLCKKDRDPLVGDLKEEYKQVFVLFGIRKAKLWYYKQVASSLVPLLSKAFAKRIKLGVLCEIINGIRRFLS